MPLALVRWIASLAVACGILHAVAKQNQDKIDRFVMGLVRDLGRYKAKKRRMQDETSHGLMLMSHILLHRDDPMEDFIKNAEEEDESDLPTYTAAELLEFGNGDDDHPILIAVFGRVYDVSEGDRFYGPGGPYEAFAGHDVTYSLCTGCRTEECIAQKSVQDLDTDFPETQREKLWMEGKRWLSFFHLHDKYPLVGKLENNYFDTLLSELLLQVDELERDEDGTVKAPLS